MNGANLPGCTAATPSRRTPVLVNAPDVFWRGADLVPVLRHVASMNSFAPPSPPPRIPSIYEQTLRVHPIALTPVSEVSRGFSRSSLRPSVLRLDADTDESEFGTAAQQQIVIVNYVDYTPIPEPRETVADHMVESRGGVELRRQTPFPGTSFVPLSEPSYTVAEEDFCFRRGEPCRKLLSKSQMAMRWSRCKARVKRCVEILRPAANAASKESEDEVTGSGDKTRYAVQSIRDRLVEGVIGRMGWRAVF
jgi:hypothetical protein